MSFSIVYSSVAFYLGSPKAFQPFIAFGIYSESGTLSSYTGGFSLPVMGNQTITWNLEVMNRMGAVQLVQLLYRLGNSTTGSPTNISPAPENAPVFGKLETFVAKGETRRFPFDWTITRTTQSGGVVFLEMTVNGVMVTPPIGAVSGNNFRFMFELWTFDLDSNSFQYGWKDQSSVNGSWLQVWFDVV